MRWKTRNIAFVLACSLVLLSSILNKGGMAIAVLPQKHSSSLEGREYQTRPALSLEALRSGDYQDAFEKYVADGIPARDGAPLLNAATQRVQIAAANLLAGYGAYPTNFGSAHAYVPAYDAIVPIAKKLDEGQRGLYATSLDTIKAFAQRHSDVRVWVLEVDNAESSSANPTHELVSNSLGTEDVHDMLLDELPAGVTAVGHSNLTAGELFQAYYRTDHHWTTPEGYLSYEEALATMRPGDEPTEVTQEHDFDCAFLGSFARLGLCFPRAGDSVRDLVCDLDGVDITIDGTPVDEGAIDSWERYASGERDPGVFANIYATFYHRDYALLEFVNPSCANDGGLLIIGNSYGNCMERFFATNYRRVVKLDGRHTDLKADELLEADPSINDVLVIGTPGAILAGSLDPE